MENIRMGQNMSKPTLLIGLAGKPIYIYNNKGHIILIIHYIIVYIPIFHYYSLL